MSLPLSEIRDTQLFAGLSTDAVELLLEEAQQGVIAKDSVIFGDGRPARAIHILTAGFVQLVQTTPTGARVILGYVGPGEPFGTSALLEDGRYSANAVAVTNAVELQWPSNTVRAILLKRPQMGFNIIRLLEARLRGAETRLRELATEPAEKRIARAVVRLVQELGQRVGDLFEVPFSLTRQDIADMTGTTLHTVSRTFAAWEQVGLVERGRQRVAVADIGGLIALAEANKAKVAPRRTHRRGMPRR